MVLLLPSGRLVLLSTHKRSENLITNWSIMLNCMLLSGCNYLLINYSSSMCVAKREWAEKQFLTLFEGHRESERCGSLNVAFEK